MTLEELEKKLKELDDLRSELNKLDDLRMELNKHIAELKAQREAKPKPPHPRWKPKDNELYYTNTGYGETCNWFYFSTGDDTRVIGRYSIGNIFRTEAEAEFAAERLKVLAEMREWAGNWDDGYTISIDPCDNTKIEIFDRSNLWPNGEMRFATREDAINCVIAVGEDKIIKYYFMIPEKWGYINDRKGDQQ